MKILTLAAQIGIAGIVVLIATYLYIDRETKRSLKRGLEYRGNLETQARSNASFGIGCALIVVAAAAAIVGMILRFR